MKMVSSIFWSLLCHIGITAAFLGPPCPSFQPKAISKKLFASDYENGFEGVDRGGGMLSKLNGMPNHPDSVARRQILYSMLASASAIPFMKVEPAVASGDKGIVAASESDMVSVPPFVALNGDILKSPRDKRKYEALTLENGLRVFLCSDPSSQEAAAAMGVHVGACSDPPEVPGLAHFCEHMLFLGTEDYPKEGSFEQFLSANSGTSNAYTDSEDTVYYFNIDGGIDTKLGEALKRFASFFTSPLFTQSATARELNAIESENAKNLQSDIFRSYQIEKARANQDHPFSKFYTGNKATLLDGTKKQGIDLREELIKFYTTYYSANQMSLAIVGPQSLDVLKKMMVAPFSKIPNKNVAPPEQKWAGIPPFKEDNNIIPATKGVVEIVPVQDLRQVTISWPLVYRSKKDSIDMELVKPGYYVSHLLGHEGPGSLLSYLKRQGWVNSLGAGPNAELSDFQTYELAIGLTSKGLANVDDVIAGVFSYIKMMNEEDIPNYVFDEVLALNELEWRFLSKGTSGGYAQSLVKSVSDYASISPTLVVAGPRRLALRDTNSRLLASNSPRTSFASDVQRSEARSATIKLATKFSLDNSIITILSKDFEGKANRAEKWYGTKYGVRMISAATKDKWANSVRADLLGIAFPKPNKFIPAEKGLRVKAKAAGQVGDTRARSFEAKMKPAKPPSLIRDDGDEGRWTVYFKQDSTFDEPKAFLIFQLLTEKVYSSALQAALASLYQSAATDVLEEYAYDARLAGLTYDIQVLPRGIRLTFGGYNDKLEDFAMYVSRKLSRDVADVLPQSDAEFDRYKDNLLRSLNAFNVKQPYAHAVYYSSLLMQPKAFQYSNSDLLDAVQKVTLSDLKAYASSLWSSGKGEALIQGNLDETEALDIVKSIDSTLAFETISADQYPTRLEPIKLPIVKEGSNPTKLAVSEPNSSNNNSATQVVIQCLGESDKDHVMLEIINSILNEPFFEDLRTKQQLGYIVTSALKAIGNTRTISFVVQSNVAQAQKLTESTMKFLNGVRATYLEPLNEGDISVYVKSVVDQKTEPVTRLAIEVTRNWSEIASGRLQFGRPQAEAAAALDVTKEDILKFWDEIYDDSSSSSGRRILISEIIPSTGSASSKAPSKSSGYAKGDKKISTAKDGSLRLGIDDIETYRQNNDCGILS